MNLIPSLGKDVHNNFETLKSHWNALRDDPNSAKALHQWRVSARRLESVLTLYANLVPDSLFSRTQDSLRELLSMSNRPRDVDAAIRWIQKNSNSDRNLNRLRHKRSAAWKKISKSARKTMKEIEIDQDRWNRSIRKLSDTLEYLAAIAMELTLLTVQLIKKAEQASTIGKLHKLRVHAKRLRYALEFLREAFLQTADLDSSFHLAINSLAEIQDSLGELQDRTKRIPLLDSKIHDKHADIEFDPALRVWLKPKVKLIAELAFAIWPLLMHRHLAGGFDGTGDDQVRELDISKG